MFKNRGMYNRTKMARLSESNEEVNENSLEMFSQEDTAFQKPLTNSRDRKLKDSIDRTLAAPEVLANEDFLEARQFYQSQRQNPLSARNSDSRANVVAQVFGDLPTSPVDEELKKLGVALKEGENDGKRLFFYKIGYATHIELVNTINDEFASEAKIAKMEKLITDTLKNDLFWKIFMLPTETLSDIDNNYSGDTVFRAFLLSRPFQMHMFELIMEKMDEIASILVDPEQANRNPLFQELKDLLTTQLMSSAHEIYNCHAVKEAILEREFEKWPVDMCAKFIDAIPEWLLDNTVHNEVLVALKDKFINLTINRHSKIREAIINSMKVLSGDYSTTVQIRKHFLSHIMKIETELIPEVVDYVLKSIRLEERFGFLNIIILLRKYLNFSDLKRKNSNEKFRKANDEMLTKIFEHIVSFAKNHAQRTVSDFRYTLFSNKERKEKFDKMEQDHEGDDDDLEEILPDTELDADLTGFHVPTSKENRNLIMFDLMFLFVMQAIKRDSRIVTEPLRDQVATGNNKVALKIFIQDGFIYTKFCSTFYRQIIQCAEDLICVQPYSSELAFLGGHILHELFINLKPKRIEILGILKEHLNGLENESKECLSVLESMIEDKKISKLLVTYLPQLIEFL